MLALRNIAVACSLLVVLACRSEPVPAPAQGFAALLLGEPEAVGRLIVVADSPPLSAAQQVLLRRHQTASVLRQSALDWLDARGRFDPDGDLALHVEIRSVRLRAELVALLFGRAAGPDHLEASVRLTRNGQQLKHFSARARSSAGGRDWRDPEERLRRLARMLGRRVAEGL